MGYIDFQTNPTVQSFCKVFACWRLASQEQRLLQKWAAKSTDVDTIGWHYRACHDWWYCENRCVVLACLCFATMLLLDFLPAAKVNLQVFARVCNNQLSGTGKHCFLLAQRALEFAFPWSCRARRAPKKFQLGLALGWEAFSTHISATCPFKSLVLITLLQDTMINLDTN